MIEGWHLILTSAGVCLAVFGFVWNFNRARRKDFNEAMEKKADKEMVNEKLSNIDKRINLHEKNNDSQFISLKESMAEYHATQMYISERIDKILEKI